MILTNYIFIAQKLESLEPYGLRELFLAMQVVSICVCVWIAISYGKSPLIWGALSLLMSVIAVVLLILTIRQDRPIDREAYKKEVEAQKKSKLGLPTDLFGRVIWIALYLNIVFILWSGFGAFVLSLFSRI